MSQLLAVPPTDLIHEKQARSWDRNHVALIVGIALFSALSLYCATQNQAFLEADGCTHYMLSRFAFQRATNVLNVWGRPLCTAIYAIPAATGGVLAVRATSLLMAIACGLVACRIAKNQGLRMPTLAALLLFSQPLFFCHSWSELTEIPFALVMILAFWAYQARRFLVMTILVALLPMGRPEGIGLVLLTALALLCHRRWYYIAIFPIPILLWSYLGWLDEGGPGYPWYSWLHKNWPYAPQSAYGRGPWYHFIMLLPVLVSPMMFPMLLVGFWRGMKVAVGKRHGDTEARRNEGNDKDKNKGGTSWLGRVAILNDHRARCEFIIFALPLGILLVHSYLWWQGKMASNGELRYLLCVAPLWALVTARGWEWIWTRYRLPGPFLLVGIFAMSPIIANYYYRVIPLGANTADETGRVASEWYRGSEALRKDFPRITASPPSIYYFLDVNQDDQSKNVRWKRSHIEALPSGVVLFWDPTYGTSNSDRQLIIDKGEIEKLGWKWIGNVACGKDWIDIYLSPKTAGGEASDPSRYAKPPGTVKLKR